MKRLLTLALAGLLALVTLSACSSTMKPTEAGSYKGTAEAYHGELSVMVELDENGTFTQVKVSEHEETDGIGTVAIEKLPDRIVEEQSLEVDTISGATVTGDAITAAVAVALKSAGLDPTKYGYTETANSEETTYDFNPNAMPLKAPITDTITVTDVKGREVNLDLPISTYAISTMDVIDYIIPLLGEDAFNKLVASGQDGGGGLQTYAKLYTPIVGNYMEHVGQISEHNAPFDLEMILAMDPDVLIVNSAMGAHNYALEVESQLTAAGIPIVLIDVPGKSPTTSVQSSLGLLGQIFQEENRAAEVVSFIDEQYALLASKNLTERADKPTVYYEKSGYSEVYGSTSASNTGWGTVIDIAGGENIADPILLDSNAEKGNNNTIDPEYVIQADPDYIVLSGSGAGWMDNIPGSTPSVPLFDIVNRTGWSSLNAVQNNNVYELAHATSRSVFGFYAPLKLASEFYPSEFEDVNPDDIMAEFFDRFMLVDSDVTGWFYQIGEGK